MKAFKALLALAFAALFSVPALAGGVATGTVTSVSVMQTGAFLFNTSVAATGGPGCAIQTARFAVDNTTAIGKGQASALMAAMLSGKTVNFFGNAACAVWGDTETLYYATVYQ